MPLLSLGSVLRGILGYIPCAGRRGPPESDPAVPPAAARRAPRRALLRPFRLLRRAHTRVARIPPPAAPPHIRNPYGWQPAPVENERAALVSPRQARGVPRPRPLLARPGVCWLRRGVHGAVHPSEKDTKLAQKLGQLQPFIAVFLLECMRQLASFGPT